MDNAPKASLVIIGNEILSGRTEDQNLNYLANGLSDVGVRFVEARVIPDILDVIVKTINELRSEFDYVFTTGGIGPTHDDITTEAVGKALGVALVEHGEALERLDEYYNGELNDGRRKMTILPEGAELIDNPISVAPGYKVENVYVMAGIPNVMRAMFDSVKNDLVGGQVMLSKELRMFVSESKIAGVLGDVQNKYVDVEIGSYPFVQDSKLGVNVVLRATDSDLLQEVYEQLADRLLNV